MYAVIKSGGKQYKVAKGDTLRLEKLAGKSGDKLTFDNILLVGGSKGLKVGRPYVDGASVNAELENQLKDKKVIVYKKKRRKGYEVRRGHRQRLTSVKITAINA